MRVLSNNLNSVTLITKKFGLLCVVLAGLISIIASGGGGGGGDDSDEYVDYEFNVSFDANGGSTPSSASKQVTFGELYGPLPTTTRTGYTFNGWFTQASGGIWITSDTTVSIESDHILYAQWEVAPPSVTLSYISISGPSNVTENSGGQYNCTAYYSDGTSSNITNAASWSENSSYASIDSGGYLTTTGVSTDQSATISASYGGKSDTHLVTISDSSSQSQCGAFVAPGVWKEFDCYNLAAIGKTTGDDPFTPSWRLIGGYWQWGRKGPESNQWYDTNTSNFAHGPTGPGSVDANSDEISGWDQSDAPDGAWSDDSKTANDPCPNGYRVPTISQWQGVLENSAQSVVGTWSTLFYDHTNYSCARFLGNELMLPATGVRSYLDSGGALYLRGNKGYYWSSSVESSSDAWFLYFGSSYSGTLNSNRWYGSSIRCISLDNSAPVTLSYISISGPSTVTENSGGQYNCTAYYNDGTSSNITHAASWSENSSYASIDSGGYLTTTGVSTDQSVTISASYEGKSDTHAVTISDSSSQSQCGAFVAPGVWKEFDCYNLAAIGKTTDDDPFTPSWRLIGGYWQWGRKGPDPSQWYDKNTLNFAHGPIGPGSGDANSDEISGWDESDAPNGAWSDSAKTANDPCPAGYRVPTISQWEGVLENNTLNHLGTWSDGDTNYSSALFLDSDLMLPAAGGRYYYLGGALDNRGNNGYYWSSSQIDSSRAWYLTFDRGSSDAHYYYRRRGFSVRCVSE